MIALVDEKVVVVVVGIQDDFRNILKPNDLGLPPQGQIIRLNLFLVLQIDDILPIHIGPEDHVFKLFDVGVVARGGDQEIGLFRTEGRRHRILSDRVLTALISDLINDLRNTDLVEGQLLGIDIDTNCVGTLTQDIDEAHAMDLLDDGIYIALNIVRDIKRVRRAGLRVERDHLKQVRNHLTDANTLCPGLIGNIGIGCGQGSVEGVGLNDTQ